MAMMFRCDKCKQRYVWSLGSCAVLTHPGGRKSLLPGKFCKTCAEVTGQRATAKLAKKTAKAAAP